MFYKNVGAINGVISSTEIPQKTALETVMYICIYTY